MNSHLTSSHLTVFRRMWTPPPTGFMTIAATRSEETAAVGVTPKKIRRMGVMRAPPPMPVRPTVNPTITDASAMDQSMCTGAKDTSTPEAARTTVCSSQGHIRYCPPGAAVADVPGNRDPLSKRDLDPDPIAQFRVWLDDARDAGIRLPEAVALGTVDPGGRPSIRHVLLRGLDERGFVFYTHYESRKGCELDANPRAGMAFYWRELDRQVCVGGTVERTSRQESEAYFRTRPREARLGAWASHQSAVVSSREELDARYREIDARYQGLEVPLPPNWGGYRLAPSPVRGDTRPSSGGAGPR